VAGGQPALTDFRGFHIESFLFRPLGHFHLRRHLLTADSYRVIREKAFNIWLQETCAQQVA
jgi:hypothetical protein